MSRGWLAWRMDAGLRAALCLSAGLMLGGISGCGTPGTPQPPSLKLPEPVVDLTAVRNGNQVTLHWTMPRRTTDHLAIATQFHAPVRARVCRREGAGTCEPAGEAGFAGGAEAEFHETLPPPLAAGEPRKLVYIVELLSPKGRSAGPSNSATVLAGAAPAPVTNLSTQVRADGVALRWSEVAEAAPSAIRLHRKLLTPAPKAPTVDNSVLKPNPEPAERELLVDAPVAGRKPLDGALDSTARFGEVYEYTAQRVRQIAVDGATLELAGEDSPPIRVDVADIFPPAVPRGLAAVYAPADKAIDLSWEPDTEPDLAGYVVYRAEQDGSWKRISGPQPVATPAFRDSAVAPGHRYRYAVSAIDLTGHESQRSAEAQEQVPGP